MKHLLGIGITTALLLAAACTTPVAGKEDTSGSGPTATQNTLAQKIWARSKVSVAAGDAHNLKPPEKAIVVEAVKAQIADIKKCFETPVLERSCRTGEPRSVDAMLMILTDGAIRDVRIVPNKNTLPRECFDAVNCLQEILGRIQIFGLERFEGTRQACMTVTLMVPADNDPTLLEDAGTP